MTRCPACGTSYADDSRFCTRDGTRLVEMPPSSATGSATPRTEPAAAPRPSLAGSTLDGRYAVEEKIGAGGMSTVYRARDLEGGEPLAIKVLSVALSRDQTAMERLRREASLGMRLAHPNLCHIIRMGETADGLVYVVMPFVQGELLSDRNNRMAVLPIEMVVRFVGDIAAGLGVAHELGIVHRDLKPENVMITTGADGAERAVVMDFGLAKQRRADAELQKLTKTGIILGTPEFMSPEQLRGKPLDPRTDVYSLALVAYEMLAGALPFTGRTQQEMMIARLRNDPMPIREARPDLAIGEAVERVLAKGMRRDAADRYPSVKAFADALADAVGGKPAGGMLDRLFGR